MLFFPPPMMGRGSGALVAGTWTPASLTNLTAWWRSDNGITYSVSPNITAWAPKSGSGTFNFVGSYPQFVASSVINSGPALQTQADSELRLTYVNTGNTLTLAWVGTMRNFGAAYGRLWSFTNSTASADWNNTTGFNVGRNNLTNQFSAAYNSLGSPFFTSGYDTPFLAVLVFNGSVGELFINGTSLGTPFTATANFNINRAQFGSSAYNPGGDRGAVALADVVLQTVAMTTTERQKVEGYFAWHYALAGLLPGGHPYKSVAP
jgi:hypothetical protein